LWIGHCLLHFSEKEVGRMTLSKFIKIYNHYKNNYDFNLSKLSYAKIEEEKNRAGEWLTD